MFNILVAASLIQETEFRFQMVSGFMIHGSLMKSQRVRSLKHRQPSLFPLHPFPKISKPSKTVDFGAIPRPWNSQHDGSPSPAIQRHRTGCCGVRPSSGRSGRSGNSYGSEGSEGLAALPKDVPRQMNRLWLCGMSLSWQCHNCI